jgi:hypothetical protein
MENDMKSDARLSSDRKYRYVLSRIWDDSKAMVTFIGINPSTADEKEDDPTIRRCINFAKSWEYGGIYMLNLFALRATHPSELYISDDPIGSENDFYLKEFADKSAKIICAWGNHGSFSMRSQFVLSNLPEKYYLKINNSGEPAHPLYLKSNLKPILF